jgi:hypothetical protein
VAISATSSTSAAASSLDDLAKQIAALQQKANQSRLTVTDFRKDTNDVQIDNKMTARDIGTLKDHKSRLNLFSALSTKDAADVFRFKVSTTAPTKLGALLADPANEGKLRIQVISKTTGRTVADNAPDAGDLKAAFDKLQDGTFELKRGDYVLRLSRQNGVDPTLKTSMSYALQLSQGTFTEDYDTVEQAKKTDGSDPYGFGTVGVNTTNLIDGLTNAYSFISSLPAIGSSSTDKLNGILFDSIL